MKLINENKTKLFQRFNGTTNICLRTLITNILKRGQVWIPYEVRTFQLL